MSPPTPSHGCDAPSRGCDAPSHALPKRFLTLLTLTLLAGCTLIARPEPKTALQLGVPTAETLPAWPAAVDIEYSTVEGAIAGGELVVFDGATQMRMQDMRWATPPLAQLRTRIDLARAAASGASARSLRDGALLRLRLQFHELQIDAGAPGQREAFVGVHLELDCPDRAHVVGPEQIQVSEPAAALTPEAIVAAFTAAHSRLVERMAQTVAAMREHCAAAAP
jgi:ABC-type uncharacterized transport system auxiliary subunit